MKQQVSVPVAVAVIAVVVVIAVAAGWHYFRQSGSDSAAKPKQASNRFVVMQRRMSGQSAGSGQ